MPEQDEKKSGATINVDLNKWLPYILIFGGWLINYGRDSNGVESLKTQVAADHAVIQGLSDKVSAQSDRLAKVEAILDTMRRELEQDRVYRNGRTN